MLTRDLIRCPDTLIKERRKACLQTSFEDFTGDETKEKHGFGLEKVCNSVL